METIKLPTLNVEPYDPWTDTIVIEGTRYSGVLFRDLGMFTDTVGQIFRIERKGDGVVWLTRLHEFEDHK